MEHSIVEIYNWSLRDIDETDIYSLLPFVFYKRRGGKDKKQVAYCDQAGWL